MISFAQIQGEQTLKLRQMVLRPNSTIEECIFPRDNDPEGFHIGAFAKGEKNEPICIASFHPDKFPKGKLGENPYRLRGMATHPKYIRQGIASGLLKFSIQLLEARGCDLLWFNARENAFKFYQSMGFEFGSELFDMPGTGPHRVMYKALSKK